jgi:hypothetical protein
MSRASCARAAPAWRCWTAARADAELAALGEDVFRYFGLGCRNVGKLWHAAAVSTWTASSALFYPWREVIHHHKYANNYDYNKAVWLLDRAPITENGFLHAEGGSIAVQQPRGSPTTTNGMIGPRSRPPP